MLFHGRISKSNRMLPFTTQIIEVVAAHFPPNLPSPSDVAAAVAEDMAHPTETVPVADPESGQAQLAQDSNRQLAQQTAFPGLQVPALPTLGLANDVASNTHQPAAFKSHRRRLLHTAMNAIA